MKHDKGNEEIFREAASLYVTQEGEKLLLELAELENTREIKDDSKEFKKRVRARIRHNNMRKITLIAGPVAAGILLVLFLWRIPLLNPNDGLSTLPDRSPADIASIPSPVEEPSYEAPLPSEVDAPSSPIMSVTPYDRIEVLHLSSRLPEGYNLMDTEYDNEKTIYYVSNDLGNNIVMVAEPVPDEVDMGRFQQIQLSGTDAYVLANSDYRTLLMLSEDMLLTLTSEFSIGELIEVAESLI